MNGIKGEDQYWERYRERLYNECQEPEEESKEEKTKPLDMTPGELYDDIVKTAYHMKRLCASMGRCDNCPFGEYKDGLVCHFMTTEPENWEVYG